MGKEEKEEEKSRERENLTLQTARWEAFEPNHNSTIHMESDLNGADLVDCK